MTIEKLAYIGQQKLPIRQKMCKKQGMATERHEQMDTGNQRTANSHHNRRQHLTRPMIVHFKVTSTTCCCNRRASPAAAQSRCRRLAHLSLAERLFLSKHCDFPLLQVNPYNNSIISQSPLIAIRIRTITSKTAMTGTVSWSISPLENPTIRHQINRTSSLQQSPT
jgi:hypothetical protein